MTAFPSLRSFSTRVPNSQSSNTMTSAQSLPFLPAFDLLDEALADLASAFDITWYLTSKPFLFCTCQARSWMSANFEMKRKAGGTGFGASFGASLISRGGFLRRLRYGGGSGIFSTSFF